MTERTLAAWLQRIEQRHPREIELGLDRVASVARNMAILPLATPAIVVAGTNGKGSVVAVAEALLTAAGHRCGAYTSPHLLRFNERIRIAGTEAADARIVAAFEAVESRRGTTSLTYFETATLAALWLFAQADLDYVILEVGLGGRLDAVNIVDAAVAVITAIDLDHQQWLGDTRDAIALEKAGVLRPGRPAVIADPAPPQALLEALESSSAVPYLAGYEFAVQYDQGRVRASYRDLSGGGGVVSWQEAGGLLPENCAAAVQAVAALGVPMPVSDLTALFAGLRLPGRRQLQLRGGVTWVLDVGHNPAGVRSLMEYLRRQVPAGRRIAVFSVMADKDIHAIIRACQGGFERWLVMEQPDVPRAAGAREIARLLKSGGEYDVTTFATPAQALAAAQSEAGAGDCIVVFGSFYTVAAALAWQQGDGEGWQA